MLTMRSVNVMFPLQGTRLQDDRSVYPLSSPIHSSAEGQKEVTIHNLETATSPNAHSQSLLVESVDNRQGISDHKGGID